MSALEGVLMRLYAAFNARNIDAALSLMHEEVDWPNGMDGGTEHGRDAVRAYWARQWTLIDPRVEPKGFTMDAAGCTIVDVHQVVRDLTGRIRKDEMVQHVYRIDGGLVRSMEIRRD